MAQQKQRVFSGVVTKMHDNFGFVDEDVFFQLSACENGIPKVRDRVIVEAQFNPSMPFKWNASRVQIDQQQLTQMQAAAHFSFQRNPMHGAAQQSRAQQQHLYALQSQALSFTPAGHGGAGILGPAPVNVINSHMPQQRQHMSGGKGNKRNQQQRSGGRERRSPPHRTDGRNRSRDEPARRKRSKTPPQKRASSPTAHRRSISNDKSVRRPAPRYVVQYAKYPLIRKSSGVLHLRSLCTNLYIPSDFFNVNYKWQKCFPLQQPVSKERCQFYVLQKDVEPLVKPEDGILDPVDADRSWTARVMLLQLPGLNEIYKQCCCLAEDGSENFLHPSRLYKFLVGYKGKKEPMAIGGLWSPSLDGPNPGSNPLTLIKTAIRTCKALTGIDLSRCSKWYRVLDVQYHRAAETRKGRTVPDRVETTVIFLPDVYSCMPTASDYKALRISYLDKLEAYLDNENTAAEENIDTITDSKAPEDDDAAASNSADAPDDEIDQKIEEPEPGQEAAEEDSAETNGQPDDISAEETGEENTMDTVETPTKPNIKSMKVGELRRELEMRGLSPKGLKATLVTRLTGAIEQEEAEEEAEDKPEEMEAEECAQQEEVGDASEEPSTEETKAEEEEEKHEQDQEEKHDKSEQEMKETEEKDGKSAEKKSEEKEEKKKIDPERLRRHYTLPESHTVIPVHPNTTYKKGMFECSTTTLSSLLNYRQEDNKESIFEISVFAEAFKEMLQRGFAFNIYQALANPLPELEKEKEDDQDGDVKRKVEDEEVEGPKAKKTKSESDEVEKEENEKETDKEINGSSEEKHGKKRSHSRDSKDSKKHRKDESRDEKEKSRSNNASKSKVHTEKCVTVRKDLLLSFVYFDQTHCGYIKEADINDIIHSIGLGLSRSQISKITSKYIEKGGLHYRKLTDVPASQVQAFRDLLERANKTQDLDALAQGNKAFLPAEDEKQETGSADTPVLKTGLALYNGVVVDVRLLQEKLRNIEDIRVELESALETVKDELVSTEQHLSKEKKDHKALESDYESTKKKLNEAQAKLRSTSEVKGKYEKTLNAIISSAEVVLPKKEKEAVADDK